MGLYTTASFGSSTAMIDYVEWGSTGHGRSGVAVGAGIWTTGDFVPAFAVGSALLYDGSGDASTDWSVGTSSPCAANLSPENPVNSFTVSGYPSPAVNEMTIELDNMQEELGNMTISVFNISGQLQQSIVLPTQSTFKIDISELPTGNYFIRVNTDRRSNMMSFIKI
jgi:hypothetical protein